MKHCLHSLFLVLAGAGLAGLLYEAELARPGVAPRLLASLPPSEDLAADLRAVWPAELLAPERQDFGKLELLGTSYRAGRLWAYRLVRLPAWHREKGRGVAIVETWFWREETDRGDRRLLRQGVVGEFRPDQPGR